MGNKIVRLKDLMGDYVYPQVKSKGIVDMDTTPTEGSAHAVTSGGVKQYVDATVKLANNAVQITYAELKSLRDAGKLVPGTQYRITDYTCTTTQSGTKSAGNVFDIIVTADDESTLNEVSRAVKHEGDTYFANCNLNAWKVWYCLDNDTERFAWADNTNGKGVIYRMIDEWNNDVPYDFKNIQFYREWDSGRQLWSTIPTDNTGVPCYTFSSGGTTSLRDMSLLASNSIYSNVIKKYISGEKQILSNNCFFGVNCYANTFGYKCYENTFGNDCYFNTFCNYCHNNIFAGNCQRNSFRKGCHNNTFGGICKDNSLGDYCNNITLETFCDYNSFDNGCSFITFGSNCDNNSFGNGCQYNTFGNRCTHNSFRKNCYSNSFGNDCGSNTFGNDCGSNIFGNRCSRNTFGNDCYCIKFAADSSASIKYDYYRYNHFGDGCQYIVFTGEGTSGDYQQVQNYNFAQGLQGTSSAYLTISGKRNRAYETYISRDTNGTIKESVIAEFENKLGNCVDLTSEQTITGVKKFESTTSVKRLSLRTEGSADDSRDSEIYVLAPQSGDLWNRMIIGGNKWAARLFIEGMSSQNYIPISDTEAVTAGYLKNFAKLDEGRTFTAAQTFGGGIDMNDTRVLKVAEPTDSTDAANKNYVDTQVKTVDDKVVALETKTNFSYLEAITIYTDNTPEHRQTNIDNIATYEDNLQKLGVDTSKGVMIPINADDKQGYIQYFDGRNFGRPTTYFGLVCLSQEYFDECNFIRIIKSPSSPELNGQVSISSKILQNNDDSGYLITGMSIIDTLNTLWGNNLNPRFEKLTITGSAPIEISSDKTYLSHKISFNAELFGPEDISGGKTILSNIQNPVSASDAATKDYVDTQVKTIDDKVVALEAKNTELTNTITTLESRIAELENIISQITIKEK